MVHYDPRELWPHWQPSELERLTPRGVLIQNRDRHVYVSVGLVYAGCIVFSPVGEYGLCFGRHDEVLGMFGAGENEAAVGIAQAFLASSADSPSGFLQFPVHRDAFNGE